MRRLLVATGLVCALVSPTLASAAISGCRTDPVLYLNTGVVIKVESFIATRAKFVSVVDYRVNGPTGTWLAKTHFSGGVAVDLSYRAGPPTNTTRYDEAVLVKTPTPGVPFTAFLRVGAHVQTLRGVSDTWYHLHVFA